MSSNKDRLKQNREQLVSKLKHTTEDLTKSIILIKGSFHYNQYDSDTNYNQPQYEANIQFLFGIR